MRKLILSTSLLGALLTGCSTGNGALAGAEVIAKSEGGITVEHNNFARSVALKLAVQHCSQFSKTPIKRNEYKNFGFTFTTSFTCD